MAKVTHRKLDIAYEYLVAAAELYYQGRHFPALTLAGAAEEIFEAVMESRNQRPASPPRVALPRAPVFRRVPEPFVPISRTWIDVAKALSPELRNLPDAAVYKRLYRAKNSAKHGTTPGRRKPDLLIEADAELEAYYMLARALENYVRLHFEPLGILRKFYREYQAGRKTAHHEGSTIGPM